MKVQKVWNRRTCISKRFQDCGSYQSVAHTFCGLFQIFNKGQRSARAQQGNGPAVTTAGPVFRDGVLQDPLLSPNGDAEWVSKAAGEVGNDGGSSQGRGGPGEAPARGFTAFTKELNSPRHCQRKQRRALRERVLLSRPRSEIP